MGNETFKKVYVIRLNKIRNNKPSYVSAYDFYCKVCSEEKHEALKSRMYVLAILPQCVSTLDQRNCNNNLIADANT